MRTSASEPIVTLLQVAFNVGLMSLYARWPNVGNWLQLYATGTFIIIHCEGDFHPRFRSCAEGLLRGLHRPMARSEACNEDPYKR